MKDENIPPEANSQLSSLNSQLIYSSAPARKFSNVMGSQETYYKELDTDRSEGCIRDRKSVV